VVRGEASPADRLLLTVNQAAGCLSLSRSHLYRYVQTGELRSVKIGRARRVPVSALEEFVQRLQDEQAEEVAW